MEFAALNAAIKNSCFICVCLNSSDIFCNKRFYCSVSLLSRRDVILFDVWNFCMLSRFSNFIRLFLHNVTFPMYFFHFLLTYQIFCTHFTQNTVLSRAKVCVLHYKMRHTHKNKLSIFTFWTSVKELWSNWMKDATTVILSIYSWTLICFFSGSWECSRHTVREFSSLPNRNLRNFLLAWPPLLFNRCVRRIAKIYYRLCKFCLSVCVHLYVLVD